MDVGSPADYLVPQYSTLLDCLLIGVVVEPVVAKHESVRIITGHGEDGFIGLALRRDNVDSFSIVKPGLYVFAAQLQHAADAGIKDERDLVLPGQDGDQGFKRSESEEAPTLVAQVVGVDDDVSNVQCGESGETVDSGPELCELAVDAA